MSTINNIKDYIYLCVRCNDDLLIQCKKFNSYEEADDNYKIISNKLENYNNYVSTMIPIPKIMPIYFHKITLNNEIHKIFYKTEIVNEFKI